MTLKMPKNTMIMTFKRVNGIKHLNVINTHFIKFFKNLSIQYDQYDLIPGVPV
jgi:hypothetical protein